MKNCYVCNNPAAADDDYCTACRNEIEENRRWIRGESVCSVCGRPARIDGLCSECFDEICNGILSANSALPPSERGGGSW